MQDFFKKSPSKNEGNMLIEENIIVVVKRRECDFSDKCLIKLNDGVSLASVE